MGLLFLESIKMAEKEYLVSTNQLGKYLYNTAMTKWQGDVKTK